jgi:hypothetical protein
VQRLEGGVPLERLALLPAEVQERLAARRRGRGEVQVAEAGEGGLEQPPAAGGGGRVVDEVRVVAACLGQGGAEIRLERRVALHLGQEVGGDQEPVQEAPAGGRVGAAVAGCREEQGVQRVERQEVRALARRRLAEGGEVGEVAAAEVARPPERVDLAADPEATVDAQVLGQGAAGGGGHDEAGEGSAPCRRPLQLKPVVALGKGCREEDRPGVGVAGPLQRRPVLEASRQGRPRAAGGRGRAASSPARATTTGGSASSRASRSRTSRSAPSPERTSTPMAASSTRLVSGVATCRTLSLSRNEASIP